MIDADTGFRESGEKEQAQVREAAGRAAQAAAAERVQAAAVEQYSDLSAAKVLTRRNLAGKPRLQRFDSGDFFMGTDSEDGSGDEREPAVQIRAGRRGKSLLAWAQPQEAEEEAAPRTVVETLSGAVPDDAPEGVEWVVLYHIAPPAKAFKGRAEFLKLLFEDANVPYHFTNKNLYGPEGWMDMFRDPQKKGHGEEVKLDTAPFPCMYPPALWHKPAGGDGEEGVFINQVSACMAYIGGQLGYGPGSASERAKADCITANAIDYIAAGRSSFHPVEDGASYWGQQEEGDRVSKLWAQSKMRVWLQHFEKVVKRAGGKSLAGGSLTYADFAVFHVLDATEAQFNNEKYEFAWDKEDIPACKAWKASFEQRPNLKAYFASDRRLPWASDSMM
jgi:glutathione S-transferase